jgi:streptogrisin C
VFLSVAGMVTALTVPAQASPAAPAPDAAPALLSAMQRDLGLTADQARTRLANEDRAAGVQQRLRASLADRFAGAWLSPDAATLTVAITDAADSKAVRAAGAEPKVVTHSERQLKSAQSTLDAAEAKAPKAIAGWYVDVASNSVVMLAPAGAAQEAAAFAAATGVDPATVRVAVSDEAPRLLYDVRGGDAVYVPGGRCSIGFSVAGGFVTAGHCGVTGHATQGTNQVAQGTFRGSSFPGNDFAWVAVNSDWVPRGLVNRYNGATVSITGSSVAAIGASICRSGSTTGWRCGTIDAMDATARYPEGTVSGLTRTTVCAEPGDSGGPLLSGTQAQGVTSGGSGNCSTGGVTYFQPVNEILSAFGLSLVTG